MHSSEQIRDQCVIPIEDIRTTIHSREFQVENSSNSSSSHSETPVCSELDLGNWIGKSSIMSRDQKLDILKRCWVPPQTYDFMKDSAGSSRSFIHKYLDTYAPWLKYTKKLKGALCLYCVLFPPVKVSGITGALMVKPFTRYSDMHDACRNHASNKVHQASTKAAKAFVDDVPVDVQMESGYQKLIEENRKILSSIISIIIFCGTHDLPLRGKHQHSGKFLMNFILGLFQSYLINFS